MATIGQKIGELTVVKKANARRIFSGGKLRTISSWIVKCSCGNTFSIPDGNLRTTRRCVRCKYDKKSSFSPGDKVGCLVVIRRNKAGTKRKYTTYDCKCECGRIKTFSCGHLKSPGRDLGACTCLKFQHHGMSNHPLYRTWCNIKDRCYNPKSKAYKHYGARGIKVSNRWLIFKNFASDIGEKSPGLSLDRINPDGDYSRRNCRWADKWTQSRNRGFNTSYRFLGKTMTLGQWIAKIKNEGKLVSTPNI